PTCARPPPTASSSRKTCCGASTLKREALKPPPHGFTTMDARSSPEQQPGVPADSLDEVVGDVGQPIPHDSAHLHDSGEPLYTDDIPEPPELLPLAVRL